MTFPSDAVRGIPAWFTKLGPMLLRARYRSSVGDSNAAAKSPLVVQGAPSQTANLIEVYDSAKNGLLAVAPDGRLITNGAVHAKALTVTLAQLKAGQVVIAGVAGLTLTVVRFRLKFTGSFTTATSINLSDTAASPVDIATVAIANATDGNVLTDSGGTGLTVGTFAAALTAGKGIQLRDVTANTAAGGTSVDVLVQYTVSG